MKQVREFKYLECTRMLIDKKQIKVKCETKVIYGRRVAETTQALLNKKRLSLDCVRVLHESILIPTLMYRI